MRVLHIGKFYPPFAGGIETFMADLITLQRAQGIDAQALVHDHVKPPWWRLWQNPHLDVSVDVPIYRSPCYGRILYAPISPLFPWWLSRLLKQQKFDVLHLHLPNTSAFFALLSPAARQIPWVIHWHSDVLASQFDQRLNIMYRVYRPWEQALLKRAKAILVTSPPYLEASQTLKPWQDKTQVIPLGLATTNAASIAKKSQQWAQQQWHTGAFKLLHVGRLTYYKGQSVLLEALAQTQGIQLLIVGRGELEGALKQQIDRLAIADKVQMLGFVDSLELEALFASCDCFCLASIERTEAFGVVLLEAMRHKKAAIVSNLADSGMSWVVQDYQTGRLVKPNDSQALAAILQHCQQQPDKCIAWGIAAHQRLNQVFNLTHITADISAVYKKVSQQEK